MIRLDTPTASLAFLLLASSAATAPLAAKTCKDPLTAKSTSRIAGDEAKRDQRAKDNAIKRWVKDAQGSYGLPYRFWFRSEGQKVDCDRTKSTSRCTVTARPCSIL